MDGRAHTVGRRLGTILALTKSQSAFVAEGTDAPPAEYVTGVALFVADARAQR